MDSEKLIILIQKRKSLWDHKEKNYHVRGVQQKLWEEVSSEINEPINALKKRWRGLRDTFRREFKKEMNESQRSSWPFFKQLYFLADTIQLRNMDNSTAAVEEEEESLSHSDSFYEPQCPSADPQCNALATSWTQSEAVGDGNEPLTSIAKKLFKRPLKKKRKCSWDEISSYDEKFVDLVSEKVKYLEEQEKLNKYGDQLFLNSLLPFLNDVPQNRKLIVRTKIMDVLIEELNRQESSSHPLSHTSAPSTPASPILSDSHEN